MIKSWDRMAIQVYRLSVRLFPELSFAQVISGPDVGEVDNRSGPQILARIAQAVPQDSFVRCRIAYVSQRKAERMLKVKRSRRLDQHRHLFDKRDGYRREAHKV